MLFEVFPAKLAAVKAATRVWGSSETQQHCNPLAIGKKNPSKPSVWIQCFPIQPNDISIGFAWIL